MNLTNHSRTFLRGRITDKMCEDGLAFVKMDRHMDIGSAEDHLYNSEAEVLRKFV